MKTKTKPSQTKPNQGKANHRTDHENLPMDFQKHRLHNESLIFQWIRVAILSTTKVPPISIIHNPQFKSSNGLKLIDHENQNQAKLRQAKANQGKANHRTDHENLPMDFQKRRLHNESLIFQWIRVAILSTTKVPPISIIHNPQFKSSNGLKLIDHENQNQAKSKLRQTR